MCVRVCVCVCECVYGFVGVILRNDLFLLLHRHDPRSMAHTSFTTKDKPASSTG